MQRKLLTNGNVFKRTDSRWGGVVWYADEQGARKRKSFSGTTKQEVNKKITAYIAEFENQAEESDESKKLLKDSVQNWLEIFKFPSVEQTTYDRCECTAQNQIYTIIGDKVVGDIKATDIKNLLNHHKTKGLSYSTVKKVYVLLNEYFRTLYLEEMISKNPMDNVEMIKKANFLSAQGKENLLECETVTILNEEELKKFKEEVYATYSNGVKATGGKTTKVGKTKTKTSKRTVPLNNAAIDAIKELREEYNYGEESPLICDEHGDYTKPVNFRKRFYRILKDAGIETKGLHSLRHTFATNLVNGVRQPDGTIRALNPKQVADLLGHTTSQITEMYYVKKDISRLNGVMDGFEI